MDAILSYEFVGSNLAPSATINGSISGNFFETYQSFLTHNLQNYLLGYTEKFKLVSNFELAYFNHINIMGGFEGYNLEDILSDLLQVNRLIARNIQYYGNLDSFFLRTSSGYHIYINNGNSHIFPVNIPLSQPLNIPVVEFQEFGELTVDNIFIKKNFVLD